ncbi:aspartate/glutamate racemase family protein [Mesorhizobium sp. INR15]|uniref:aspartate/glutamate racemase family protein n=1 Tax=Mesorhizobium sp. INR15 TaxID=2654248 RepID=UPI0018964919|nr:aspartate/glutamate racemase family protein [Mesorhizobium sp. INR15]QPC92611.1 aspartate/glutamate racemase family protein [Mesorhizobium sp. INR15]
MTRIYLKRRPQPWAGDLIGILTLEASIPYVVGNVSNAGTYDFPVRYKTIGGASIDRLLNQSDQGLLQPVLAAAKELEQEGVRAITGACGFMALFQREVSNALSIPVFLSSLLQVPLLHATTGRPVGIITANSKRLHRAHLEACGIASDLPVVIRGMQDEPEFRSAILEESGSLDSAVIEAETVSVAKRLIADHPAIGAILLECSDLPPYSKAIQAATDRPVFDYNTMIGWMVNGVRSRGYS